MLISPALTRSGSSGMDSAGKRIIPNISNFRIISAEKHAPSLWKKITLVGPGPWLARPHVVLLFITFTGTMCEVLQDNVTLLHFIKLLKDMDMGFHAIPSKLLWCTYTNGTREIVAIFKPQKWKRVNGVIMKVQLWKFKFMWGLRPQTKLLRSSFKCRNNAAVPFYYPVARERKLTLQDGSFNLFPKCLFFISS